MSATATRQATCAYDDCVKPAHARGWCGTHYARWTRLGTLDLPAQPQNPCSVNDCAKPSYCQGWCTKHYQRVHKFGALHLTPAKTVRQRLAERHVIDDAGCWLWQGSAGLNGYGRMSVNDTLQYAHRLSYEAHVGPIPEGLTIDHLCRVRMCINPEHLEPVTLAENSRREAAARRTA